MKKLSISLLVMLLIASLFTSCSMGSDDASDVRVKVRLTPSGGGGRSLTTDIETINLDDDSITWHYSATKVSETQFNYGATSDSLLPKDGIVTLSQGQWNIELRGFKDGKKVYTGTTNNVTIKWNFYEPNVTVPVPVNENTGDKGYIVFDNVTINLKTNDDKVLKVFPNYVSVDGVEITNLNGAYMKIECAPGNHYVTFAYKDTEDILNASKPINVTVNCGRSTTISGSFDCVVPGNLLLISNAQELMDFASSVNSGTDYKEKTIMLIADIDLSGKTWVPIGNAVNPFKGTFDGNNHKISNLSINGTTNYVGLFGFLDGGIVENIEIQSVSITNTSDDTGAAVGRIINGGKVSNVKVLSGSITGNKRTGGVVGTIKAYGTIENCTNAASVTSNTYNAGGIAGAAYYTESGKEMYITSCENTGSVTSNGNCAGGIVGLSAANVTGCTNRAKITGSGTSIGGIVGEQKTYGSVTNNTNTGSVENTNNGNYGNGGIIGWLRYHGTGEASSYAVSDIISVTGNKNSGNVSGGNDAGGIVGTVYNSAVVTGNTNSAGILKGTTFAAGIVGNYQTTETPAASDPALNKLTFAGNTNNTSFDNIEATNKNSLIYTNGNPIITPLAYMDNFSFCEIDSNGTQVGVPVYTTDFSNDVAENFCPYLGHGGANSNSNTHDNFVGSFVVSNGVAEIYRNSAWKHFDDIESSKTYEIRYDLKINELYNRKTSDGLDKALGFDFGERNHWESKRLLFAKDENELKVYLNSFDDTNARTIQAGKVYTITITFSQSIINVEENQKNRLTVNVKVIDPETKSVAFGPVEFTSIGDRPFNSYYWDIYYSIN